MRKNVKNVENKKKAPKTTMTRIKVVENIKMYSFFTYFLCAIGVVGNNDLNLPVPTGMYVGCVISTLMFAFLAYYEGILRERRLCELRCLEKRERDAEIREAAWEAYLASDDDSLEFIDFLKPKM